MAHAFNCNPSNPENITDRKGFFQSDRSDRNAKSINCFAQLHFKLDQIQKIVEGGVVLDDDTKPLIKVCLIAIYEAHVTSSISSTKFNKLILAKSYNDEPPEYQLNQSSVEQFPNFFEILKKNGTAKGVLEEGQDAKFHANLIILNQTVANSILERITVLLNILKNTKPPEKISENLQIEFSNEMKRSKYKKKLDNILAIKKQQSVSPAQAKGQDTAPPEQEKDASSDQEKDTSSDQEKDTSSDQEKDTAPPEQEQDILLQIEILVSDSIYIKIDQDTDVPMPTLAEATRITDTTTDKVVTDMLNKFNTNTIFKTAIMKLNNILGTPPTSAAKASEAYKLTAQVLITSNEVKLKINDFVELDGGSALVDNFVKYVSAKSINEAFFKNLDKTIFERFNKNTTSPSSF